MKKIIFLVLLVSGFSLFASESEAELESQIVFDANKLNYKRRRLLEGKVGQYYELVHSDFGTLFYVIDKLARSVVRQIHFARTSNKLLVFNLDKNQTVISSLQDLKLIGEANESFDPKDLSLSSKKNTFSIHRTQKRFLRKAKTVSEPLLDVQEVYFSQHFTMLLVLDSLAPAVKRKLISARYLNVPFVFRNNISELLTQSKLGLLGPSSDFLPVNKLRIVDAVKVFNLAISNATNKIAIVKSSFSSLEYLTEAEEWAPVLLVAPSMVMALRRKLASHGRSKQWLEFQNNIAFLSQSKDFESLVFKAEAEVPLVHCSELEVNKVDKEKSKSLESLPIAIVVE